MKIVYLAPIGLFDDWAHAVQITKMCETFSKNGHDVTLIVPNRKVSNNGTDPMTADPYEYNHVEKVFKIIKLPFFDFAYSNPSRFFYWLRFLSFFISSRIYLMFYGYDVLYTREHYFAPFFRNVVLEKHHLPKVFTDFHRFFFTKARNIIVITSFLKDRLINLGIASENIYIAPDAVDPDDFKDVPSIAESRAKLGLSVTDNIFGYYGTLKTMGMEKGVKTGIDSLHSLPENYKFYVVGGDPVDVAFYKSYADSVKMSNRVVFAGRISLKDRPLYIGACESMVAPFPVNEHYSYFMSPLKIFEYMASKRPIIVSDLPTLKEILEDNVNALFVPPERPDLLAEAIKKLKEDEGLRNKLVENAYKKVLDKYTWKARAEGIINFVNR